MVETVLNVLSVLWAAAVLVWMAALVRAKK
jgi:hypothetical protein